MTPYVTKDLGIKMLYIKKLLYVKYLYITYWGLMAPSRQCTN